MPRPRMPSIEEAPGKTLIGCATSGSPVADFVKPPASTFSRTEPVLVEDCSNLWPIRLAKLWSPGLEVFLSVVNEALGAGRV